MSNRVLFASSAVFLVLFLGVGGYVLRADPSSSSHAEMADKYGREYGVDPALVNAVIQAESSGRPGALSHAGARGLMQLMPKTASEMAQRLDLPPLTKQDLFNPDLNIRLGTYYLHLLGEEFDHVPELVLAAYNAGPGSVRRWMGAHPRLSPSRLLRTAAYPETRAYVRKVMDTWKCPEE